MIIRYYRYYVIGVLLLLAAPEFAEAQLFRSNQYWKQYRREIWLGLGVSNFLGDLGGRDQIGSDFIYDLELSLTKFSIHGGYSYYLTERSHWKTTFTYGKLWGDDRLTQEFYRSNRNLHFKSILLELATHYQYHFIQEKMGHRYNLKGARGMKGFILGFYAFAGIGVFYFNPKAMYAGQWVPLQPLGTEGQGIGPLNKYMRFNISLPVGFGFRYAINYQWRLGIEVDYRKTFTDYIDDVSTVYFSPDSLQKYRGPASVYLADPSYHRLNPNGVDPTLPGFQRGDQTDKDAYLFGYFTISYKLAPKRRRFRRVGRRRALPSF